LGDQKVMGGAVFSVMQMVGTAVVLSRHAAHVCAGRRQV
jgi:hypothetical protein